MTSWEFPGSDPIDILIDIMAGSVAVSAEPTDVTAVSLEPTKSGRNADQLLDRVQVSFADGRLEIVQPKGGSWLRGHESLDLTVKAPVGSTCTVRTASADVACMGELAGLEAKTASGDVTAASVDGPLQVKTASGDIWLEKAGSTAQLNTASGDIQLRQAAGDVSAHTASGDVKVGQAGASVTAESASGDIQVGRAERGQVMVKTASGDVQVGVAPGVGVYLDLSSLTGALSSQLDETDGGNEDGDVQLQISCRSVSGRIKIIRAAAQ
jgi:DUF4097 and DUF4098 domain-containing protein YvlB